MTKTVFIFAILVVFVAIAAWFFIQKTKKIDDTANNINPGTEPAPNLSQPTQQVPNRPIKYDNGLVVQDLLVGSGKVAANGDTLNAHYVGMLEDGTKFDSSYDRGQPLEFVLGSGQLIKGWELGLIGMKEGGKRKLTIPSELGYGSKGAGGVIPPNATLFFEIELVSVKKP